MGEDVMARIGRDIAAATGLSGPDFGILSRLAGCGNGELRQQTLAESMGWDKSRLSHQLTRMQERELIERREAETRVVIVVLTRHGREKLEAARAHSRAIGAAESTLPAQPGTDRNHRSCKQHSRRRR